MPVAHIAPCRPLPHPLAPWVGSLAHTPQAPTPGPALYAFTLLGWVGFACLALTCPCCIPSARTLPGWLQDILTYCRLTCLIHIPLPYALLPYAPLLALNAACSALLLRWMIHTFAFGAVLPTPYGTARVTFALYFPTAFACLPLKLNFARCLAPPRCGTLPCYLALCLAAPHDSLIPLLTYLSWFTLRMDPTLPYLMADVIYSLLLVGCLVRATLYLTFAL